MVKRHIQTKTYTQIIDYVRQFYLLFSIHDIDYIHILVCSNCNRRRHHIINNFMKPIFDAFWYLDYCDLFIHSWLLTLIWLLRYIPKRYLFVIFRSMGRKWMISIRRYVWWEVILTQLWLISLFFIGYSYWSIAICI